MEIERIGFFFIYALCLGYAIIRKPVFDFYTLAMVSSLVYFLPGLFGFVNVPGERGERQPIEAGVYFIYFVVITLLLVAAMVHDKSRRLSAHHSGVPALHGSQSQAYIAFTTAIIAGMLFIALGFDQIMGSGKPEYGREHAVYGAVVPLAATVAFILKKRMIFVFLLAFILIDVYSGNREYAAFTLISVMTAHLFYRSKKDINSKLMVVVGSMVFVVIVVYKELYAALRAGNFGVVGDRLLDMHWYVQVFTAFEPFTTQAVLNRLIDHSGEFGGRYFANASMNVFPILGGFVVERTESMAYWIDNEIFSEVDSGVARNIWAEAFVVGGYALVFIYAVIYAVLPWALNVGFIKAKTIAWQALLGVTGAILLFYIHRTGLEYNLTLLTRVWLYYFVALFLFRHMIIRKTWV